MRWVRSRLKLVSSLALFGLLLQLALSFGHNHRKDILGDRHSSPAVAASAKAAWSSGAGSDAPGSDRSSHDHEDGYCTVYAINALLNAGLNFAPSVLPLPGPGISLQRAAGYDLGVVQSRHLPSRARAPPLA
jgi:hypothetical protein